MTARDCSFARRFGGDWRRTPTTSAEACGGFIPEKSESRPQCRLTPGRTLRLWIGERQANPEAVWRRLGNRSQEGEGGPHDQTAEWNHQVTLSLRKLYDIGQGCLSPRAGGRSGQFPQEYPLRYFSVQKHGDWGQHTASIVYYTVDGAAHSNDPSCPGRTPAEGRRSGREEPKVESLRSDPASVARTHRPASYIGVS